MLKDTDLTSWALGLSEANFHKDQDISALRIKDYVLHTCPTLDNPSLNVSRVVDYSYKDVIFKERYGLVSNALSVMFTENKAI